MKKINKCRFCGKVLRKENKYSVCSNCGNKRVYDLLKEGKI